ncbi:hypothetical protein CEXT_362231 [Caerostris extrusa]|uniref:Uncharacterized protein n=1 Tax=Caerostris extrusa TaxID=172846 RepID=A0AAV4MFC5_CAEEX|nr:hypothetical protein CEXT_362231 [Caerostris extrusa]
MAIAICEFRSPFHQCGMGLPNPITGNRMRISSQCRFPKEVCLSMSIIREVCLSKSEREVCLKEKHVSVCLELEKYISSVCLKLEKYVTVSEKYV